MTEIRLRIGGTLRRAVPLLVALATIALALEAGRRW